MFFKVAYNLFIHLLLVNLLTNLSCIDAPFWFLFLKIIKWTPDILKAFMIEVCIDFCCFAGFATKEFLYVAEVCPTLQEVCRNGYVATNVNLSVS